jgi:glycosyltransferase involved in cell wall biosynthesis
LVYLLHPEFMARYNAFVHALFLKRSIQRADAIIAVSERTKQDLVARLGVDRLRITVVHHGVEDDFHVIDPVQVTSRLQTLGVSGRYILSVGTLEPRKNYPLLLCALALLPKPISLVIAGRPGWKYKTILAEAMRLRLGDRIRFMQYVSADDLVALYNGALFSVMPSVYEGFGLPVIQAMACGTPVLASNCSSLPEVGSDAAAYFESGSVESLRAEMLRLIENPGLRQDLRARGLVRARQFKWEDTARAVLRVLHGETIAR